MKHALIMLAPGYEELEVVTVLDVLRRADIRTDLVSVENTKFALGAHGLNIEATHMFGEVAQNGLADLIILPGGGPGAERLRKHKGLHILLQKYRENDKYIAAICAGPTVLPVALDLRGTRLTCYPGCEEPLIKAGAQVLTEEVVVDGKLITGRGPAAAMSFSFKLVESLLSAEIAISVKKGFAAVNKYLDNS